MTDDATTDTERLLRKLAARVLGLAVLAGIAGAVVLAMALVMVAVGLLAATNAGPAGERRPTGGRAARGRPG